MTTSLDDFSWRFVNFSAAADLPVLEIGAAYGIATIEALKLGAKVIANDLDERHLILLKERTPSHLQSNLTTLHGDFPGNLRMESDSVSGILICRVLHFFDGEKLRLAFKEAYRALAPGGKLFIVADTPYLGCFQAFVPIYEERKESGDPWPGFIENLEVFAGPRAPNLPKCFHALDVEVLSRELGQAGFQVEEAELFEHTNYPGDLRLDKREGVGIVAVKPRLAFPVQ